MNSIKAILIKAKEYLTIFGWIQDNYGNPSSGFCLTGACRAAVDVTHDRDTELPPILNDVWAVFTEPLKARGRSPWRYRSDRPDRACTISELNLYKEPFADAAELIEVNDHYLTTKDYIINLIDEAISECENTR